MAALPLSVSEMQQITAANARTKKSSEIINLKN
jgi:hypothetical protein